jgi:predicted glycogen debranching enzyme
VTDPSLSAESPRGPVTLECDAALLADRGETLSREWLVTNGLGGYAMGTISGARTRRYHGLLVAATRPPAERAVLLAKLEERLVVDGVRHDLSTNLWSGGDATPAAPIPLVRFRLERGVPVWRFEVAGVILEKRLAMALGENVTLVEYRLMPHSAPCELALEALVTNRSHHELTPAKGFAASATRDGQAIRVRLGAHGANGPNDLWLACAGDGVVVDALPADTWWERIDLPEDRARGYDGVESALHAATFRMRLDASDRVTFAASAGLPLLRPPSVLLLAEEARRQSYLESAGVARASAPWRQAALAADQFVVRRPLPSGRDGWSVIAGYPWFTDWSRDTLLSLDGLLLATRRHAAAKGVLETYAASLSGGLLPNRFPDRGTSVTEFNAVDAPLLFVRAVGLVDAACSAAGSESPVGMDQWRRRLWPAMRSIGEAFLRGTRHGIRVDPSDALVVAGEPGVALTWMDANLNGRVITPRIGKPVEINALWYEAVRRIEAFARILGEDTQPWTRLADRISLSFARFWNPVEECLFDVLDGPDGNDESVRPNQVVAVGLDHVALPREQVRCVVERAARDLLVPLGLRTLSPDDHRYRARYEGDVTRRDESYHQGPAWAWLLASFVRAWLRTGGDPATAIGVREALTSHLGVAGMGSVSELCDAEAPFAPRGCPAQAWSVAAYLEILRETERVAAPRSNGTEAIR